MAKTKLDYQREARKLREQLRELTANVQGYCSRLDYLMAGQESTVERGKKIAQLTNHLQTANDSAMHFGLGLSFKRIGRIKKLHDEAVRRINP